MIRIVFCLMLGVSSAQAGDYTADAFGVVPTDRLGTRAGWAGVQTGPDASSKVQPAGPAAAALLFVGPKSIVAGIEDGHAVAVGLDALGNLVDGADARFELGFGAPAVTQASHGIADILFRPPVTAKGWLAGAEIDGVQTARADYRVTSYLATVQPGMSLAPGRVLPDSLASLSSILMMDRFGNTVEDGVGLTLLLEGESGATSFLVPVTRDGVARATLMSRSLSGDLQGRLALAGNEVAGTAIEIERMQVDSLGAPVVWPVPEIAAVQLRIGPLETADGYLVPDGTQGKVVMSNAEGEQHAATGWVLDGHLLFAFPVSPDSGPFDVAFEIAETRLTQRIGVTAPPGNLIIRGAE